MWTEKAIYSLIQEVVQTETTEEVAAWGALKKEKQNEIIIKAIALAEQYPAAGKVISIANG